MNLVEIHKYNDFVNRIELNRVCKIAKLPTCRTREWIRLPAGLETLSDNFCLHWIIVAAQIGISPDTLQEAVLACLSRYKGVVGVKCQDAVLIHPKPFLRALAVIVNRVMREDNRAIKEAIRKNAIEAKAAIKKGSPKTPHKRVRNR